MSSSNNLPVTYNDPTELGCLADVCIVPLGTSSPSVSDTVFEIENYLRNNTLNVKTTLHSAGTTLEGEMGAVFQLIKQVHLFCHKNLNLVRLHTEIRTGSRIDKNQTASEKVETVEKKIKEKYGS
ncbi:hypothetical protein HANVADRAFT_51260 [Hanseniaspora valbyensis NRRL Y-1626]|uniref:Thiamine-binding protein domain-containing protein n=1 Tax=Hanseniaspora valbyensis NRRL Y-1626 TaxID=766949 RepID=A0A1B7TJJ7_9ASCO|nr:hypothetical protein HANVADRAFT_51260 [Hanseniaspora valbyensis NRRL Y-1626]